MKPSINGHHAPAIAGLQVEFKIVEFSMHGYPSGEAELSTPFKMIILVV
jgi:hypothetical protein